TLPPPRPPLFPYTTLFRSETRYLRYFGAYPRIPPKDLERFTVVDHYNRVALVAVLGDDVVGVGRYERIGEGSPNAEVAFVVDDRSEEHTSELQSRENLVCR